MENIGLSGYPLKVHLFYYKNDKVYISTNVHSSDKGSYAPYKITCFLKYELRRKRFEFELDG
jgi:hypothetical protein